MRINERLVIKLRIYAMLMRLQELEIERKQKEYFKQESMPAMKITAPYLHEELYDLDVKSGRENRRERRKKERKLKKKNGNNRQIR